MAEYIEREAFVEDARLRLCKDCINDGGGRCLSCWVDNMLDEIEDAPAADVVEVRHGEWKYRGVVKKANTANAPIVACSVCQIAFCDLINNHNFMYRFCPYCGAKMDGERREVCEKD